MMPSIIGAIPDNGDSFARRLQQSQVFDFDFTSSASLDPRIAFGRASAATYIDSTGLLRTSNGNLIQYSQNLPTGWMAWDSTVSTDGTLGPDGSTPAYKLTEDTVVNVYHGTNPSMISTFAANTVYTWSIYVKPNGRDVSVNVESLAGNYYGAYFNLANSTLHDSQCLSDSITPIDNGWVRVSCTFNSESGVASGHPYIQLYDASSGMGRYTGDGSSGVYLWGGQLELGTNASPYVATTTAENYFPRFDYDPITHQLNGLLMEGAATNIQTYSAIDATHWTCTSCTLTTDGTLAPDGSIATKYIETTANAIHTLGPPGATQAMTANTVYTWSAYVKSINGRGMQLTVHTLDNAFSHSVFDPTACLVTTDSYMTSYTRALSNGWCRVAAEFNSMSGATSPAAYMELETLSPFQNSYAGDGTSGIYVWGAQLEVGSFPTSYIPTTTSAVTRAADSAQYTNMSWYNPNEGTLFAQYVNLGGENSANYNVFGVFNTNTAGTFSHDAIELTDQATTLASNVETGGSAVFSPGGTVSGAGGVNKQALAYASGDFALSLNGVAPATQSGGSLPAPAAYSYIGSQPDGNIRNRYIQKTQYYNTRLSDSDVQRLTQ